MAFFNSEGADSKFKKKKRDPKKVKKFRKKSCKLCLEGQSVIDYKDVTWLQRFLTEKGNIIPRRVTGTCAGHQRMLAKAVKRARQISLIPYTVL